MSDVGTRPVRVCYEGHYECGLRFTHGAQVLQLPVISEYISEYTPQCVCSDTRDETLRPFEKQAVQFP